MIRIIGDELYVDGEKVADITVPSHSRLRDVLEDVIDRGLADMKGDDD